MFPLLSLVSMKRVASSGSGSSQETMKLSELPPAINFRDVSELDPTKLKSGILFRSSEMFKYNTLHVNLSTCVFWFRIELLEQYGIKVRCRVLFRS